MVAIAMATRDRSLSADAAEEGAVKPKMLSSSPALSTVSTVALSGVEVLEFSDDEEDCGADEPSDAFQWCLVGSRIAPVFASLLDENMVEESPFHKPQSETASCSSVINNQGDEQWRQVGLRLAAVMKEAADQVEEDEEELPFGPCVHRSDLLHAGANAEDHSWRVVGQRLACVFSSLDCHGEIAPPTTRADEVAVVSGPKGRSFEDHKQWCTVGSRLAAVLKTAEQ